MAPESRPLTSVEVRWFVQLDGSPEPFEQWIRTDWAGGGKPSPPHEETRTDSYLLVPGTDIGAKKRSQQQLEVKFRREAGAPRRFGRHAGRVERWTKWPVDNLSAAALPQDVRSRVEQATSRVDVRKTRWQRRLAVDANGIREVPVDRWVERAVGVELTCLDVRDRRWWSVGFEAFPDDDVVREAFDATATRVLEPLRAVALTAPASMGYPEWLATQVSTGH